MQITLYLACEKTHAQESFPVHTSFINHNLPWESQSEVRKSQILILLIRLLGLG